MGMGDDMMYLGEAYRIHQATGKKIAPQKDGKIRAINYIKQPSFKNIDWLDINGHPVEQRPNGKRWYHDVESYKPIPAPIKLTEQELAWGESIKQQYGDYIVVNPDAKSNAHHANNKHWPWKHWQRLVEGILDKDYVVLRAKPPGHHDLYGAVNIATDVRQMFVLIKNAHWVITTDGLAHHTAAAFNTPCTVIWGHCTSPKHLGYEYQKNILSDLEDAPCYTIHEDCEKCKETMENITPKQVLETIK